jgi:glutathione peroxidase
MSRIANFSLFFCLTLGLSYQAHALLAMTSSIYDFTMKTIDGKEQSLADFKGEELLIVNTASKCGHTPQYKSLETLYKQYKTQGFVILAFPENNFKNQEPGSDDQIKQFCDLNYHVTFPLFSKISVIGTDMSPLYLYLTTQSGFNGPITWNFAKFLIDPQGKVVARYDPKVDPLDPQVVADIQKHLPKN